MNMRTAQRRVELDRSGPARLSCIALTVPFTDNLQTSRNVLWPACSGSPRVDVRPPSQGHCWPHWIEFLDPRCPVSRCCSQALERLRCVSLQRTSVTWPIPSNAPRVDARCRARWNRRPDLLLPATTVARELCRWFWTVRRLSLESRAWCLHKQGAVHRRVEGAPLWTVHNCWRTCFRGCQSRRRNQRPAFPRGTPLRGWKSRRLGRRSSVAPRASSQIWRSSPRWSRWPDSPQA